MRLFATGRHQLGDGQGPARRHAPRGEDGLEGHRAGADHRRAEERRDPQERPQVRRGPQRAAQGDLRAARPDPRQAPTCASASSPSTCRRPSRPSSTPTAWPTTTRSGTSPACTPTCSRSGRTTLTVEDLGEPPPAPRSSSSSCATTAWRTTRPASRSSAPAVLRQVERQVMLRIIDTRWREHLYEMDYLQEGINLRAMGQRDPLTEWQREGFEMFGQMMQGIAQDLVRYVMHVQVQVSEPAKAQAAAAAEAAAARGRAGRRAEGAGRLGRRRAAAEEAAEAAEAEAEAEARSPSEAEPRTAEPPRSRPRDEAEADEQAARPSADGRAVARGPRPPPARRAPSGRGRRGARGRASRADGRRRPEPRPTSPPSPRRSRGRAAAPRSPRPAARTPTSELGVTAQIAGDEAEVQILGYSMPDDPSSGGGMAGRRGGAAPGRRPAGRRRRRHDDARPSRPSGRRRPATRPAPAAAARSTSAATAPQPERRDARLHRPAGRDAQAARRRRAVPEGRGAAGPPPAARDRGVAARPVGRRRRGQARHRRAVRASSTTSSSYERLVGQLEDAETLHELAREVDDAVQEPRDRGGARRRSTASCAALELRSMFSGEHDERDALCTHPGGRGRRRRAGLGRDALPHVRALGRAPRLRRRGGVVHAGLGGGAVLGRVRREGPLRLRLPAGRAGRAPPRPHEPVQRAGQAPDGVRRAAGRADAPRGRRADRDRRGRHQDGRLPGLGRRRPAHQQDVVGRAPHPPAHRDRRVLPDRAVPAPEPGQGHGDAQGQAGRGGAPQAGGGARRDPGRAAAGGLRQPDPQLRHAAVPDGQGPPDRARGRERPGRARRRPRPLHGGLPPVAQGDRASTGTLGSRPHDQARERLQGLQGRCRRPPRRLRRGPEGRVRLPRRRLRLREVHVPAPGQQGGDARAGPDLRGRQGHRHAVVVEGARTCAATSAASSRTSSS